MLPRDGRPDTRTDPRRPDPADPRGYALAAASHGTPPSGAGPNGTSGADGTRGGNPHRRLDGACILLVEDQAMVAMDIEYALEDAGAQVLGPAVSLDQAIELAQIHTRIDAAILDVDLGGEDVTPLAELLSARAVPFLFHTSAGPEAGLARRFPEARLRLKPVAAEDLLDELAALLG